MSLSMSDKQKYIQYLQSRGKAIPEGLNSHIVIEFSENEDPIMTIMNSILETFKQNNPEEFNSLSDDDLTEVQSSLYSYLLSEGFAMVFDQEEGYYQDPELFNQSRKIEEIDELLAFVFVQANEDPKVAEMFTKGLFKGYYEYCEKRELPTDPSYKEIVNK